MSNPCASHATPQPRDEATPTPRVFIVGCPRSGTTLLQTVVGAHPSLCTFPETHFFARTMPRFQHSRLVRPESLRATTYLARAGIPFEVPNRFGLPQLSVEKWVRSFTQSLDNVAIAQGHVGWLEKSPENVSQIKHIEAFVPDATFIHILRNGLPVAKSMLKAAETNPAIWRGIHKNAYTTLQQCAQRWIRDVTISLDHSGKSKHILIRYDDLVSETDTVARALYTWLGLAIDPATAAQASDRRRAVAERVVLPHETWKSRVSDAISAQPNKQDGHADSLDKNVQTKMAELESKISALPAILA